MPTASLLGDGVACGIRRPCHQTLVLSFRVRSGPRPSLFSSPHPLVCPPWGRGVCLGGARACFLLGLGWERPRKDRHSTASPAGLGLALNFQPSLIMLGLYLRAAASGHWLAAAGSPVFLSALSPLGQQLLEHFGWRGGFLLLGGLLLNCCACGAVMRPPPGPARGRAGTAQETRRVRRRRTARPRVREAPSGGRTCRRLLT